MCKWCHMKTLLPSFYCNGAYKQASQPHTLNVGHPRLASIITVLHELFNEVTTKKVTV